MKTRCCSLLSLGILLCAIPSLISAGEFGLDAGKYAVFQTSSGGFIMQLYPEKAPQTVENFASLAAGKKPWRHPVTMVESTRPLYDNTQFYFVLADKEVRGGDPVSRGTGGPGYNLSIEKSATVARSEPGLVCMDTTVEVSNGSRFNINLDERPTEQAVVFGKIVQGLDILQEVSRRPATGGRPLDPVTIQSVSIVDVPKGSRANGRFVDDNDVKAVELDRDMVAVATPTPAVTPTPTATPTKKASDKAKPAGDKAKEKEKAKSTEKEHSSAESKSKPKTKAAAMPKPDPTPVVEEPVNESGKSLLFWRKKK